MTRDEMDPQDVDATLRHVIARVRGMAIAANNGQCDLYADAEAIADKLNALRAPSAPPPGAPTAWIVSSGGDYWSEPMCDEDDAKGVAAYWRKDGLVEPIVIHPLYLGAAPRTETNDA